MRKLISYIITASLCLLAFSSCNQEVIQDVGHGYLSISLENDLGEDVVTKAGEEMAFSIDVLNSSGVSVATVDDHRTTEDNPMELKVGNYTVVAKSGEKLDAAFDAPYYEGRSEVKILPSRSNVANISCKLANTKFSVEFPEEFSKFTEYEVSVTNGKGSPLVLSNVPEQGNPLEAGLDSKAYFSVTGSLVWTVSLVNTDGGRWTETVTYTDVTAGQHYHLRFAMGEDETDDGAIVLKLTLQEWGEDSDHDLFLDFDQSFGVASNADFPVASGSPVSVAQGDTAEKTLTFSAAEGMRSLVIAHNNSALASAGLPKSIELVGATDAQLASLEAAGVVVGDGATKSITSSTRNVSISIAGLLSKLPLGSYSIDFNMVDNRSKTDSFKLMVDIVLSVDPVEAIQAKAGWAAFAQLEGRINDESKRDVVTFQYKKSSSSSWNEMRHSDMKISSGTYSAILTGLQPSTTYVFRAVTDDTKDTKTVSFTTAASPTIHNLSFDNWSNSDKYPNASGYSIWDSANSTGVTTTTTPTTDAVKGKAARLESVSAMGMGIMAAGNIFTGEFLEVVGFGARLSWGIPFTGKPLALRGYYKYSPVTINKVKDPYKDLKGQMDQCQILICLTDWNSPFEINTDEKQFVDFDNDSGIIAFAQFNTSESSSQYQKFTLPLVYRDNTRIPKYLILAGASSRYGDYFTGGIGSTLFIDEFELVYDPADLTDEEYQAVFGKVKPF